MIFWLSAMVTISGLVLSCWQFWEASHVTKQSETGELRLTSAVFSAAFKFRSIGALVLFTSAVYLLIYAKFIYPIHVVEILSSPPEVGPEVPMDVYEDSVGEESEDPIQPLEH